MDKLIADLKDLAARHAASPGKDFGSLLGNLNAIIARAEENPETGQYQYRHQMGWDNTWMDLDESQLEHVLKHGHIVERRRVSGGWERYTGGRIAPVPEFGMFPIDAMAPRPETPHAERIFAASQDLYEAWEQALPWAVEMPLHRAYVFFFMEVINDAVGDLITRWKDNGMAGEFPDALAVQDELRRIICHEDQPREAGTAKDAGAS